MTQPEFGATAWGRAWLRTLERTSGVPNPQLPKARSLARNQQATLALAFDNITATVVDSATTHHVVIPITRWSEAEQAAADLLLADTHTQSVVGDLPDQLIGTLTNATVSIAISMSDLTGSCTCRSRTKPCAHILATLYGLILLIDERPVTAIEIRTNSLQIDRATDPGWMPLTAIRAENFYTSARG